MKSTSEQHVSAILAEWIEALDPASFPEAVRIACEDTVIDTVALTIAALDTDYGNVTRVAFDARDPCTAWGVVEGTDMTTAAVVNGTCGHGEDCDNTVEGCPIHSGVVIVPAVFAAAEALGLSNARVATGLVVSIKLANQLGVVAGKGIHAAGFRGPGSVFEGVHGLYAAFAPSVSPDFVPLIKRLGSDWQAARDGIRDPMARTKFLPKPVRIWPSPVAVPRVPIGWQRL